MRIPDETRVRVTVTSAMPALRFRSRMQRVLNARSCGPLPLHRQDDLICFLEVDHHRRSDKSRFRDDVRYRYSSSRAIHLRRPRRAALGARHHAGLELPLLDGTYRVSQVFNDLGLAASTTYPAECLAGDCTNLGGPLLTVSAGAFAAKRRLVSSGAVEQP